MHADTVATSTMKTQDKSRRFEVFPHQQRIWLGGVGGENLRATETGEKHLNTAAATQRAAPQRAALITRDNACTERAQMRVA